MGVARRFCCEPDKSANGRVGDLLGEVVDILALPRRWANRHENAPETMHSDIDGSKTIGCKEYIANACRDRLKLDVCWRDRRTTRTLLPDKVSDKQPKRARCGLQALESAASSITIVSFFDAQHGSGTSRLGAAFGRLEC